MTSICFPIFRKVSSELAWRHSRNSSRPLGLLSFNMLFFSLLNMTLNNNQETNKGSKV